MTSLTYGVEVWTEVGGVWVGKVVGAFKKTDGSDFVVMETLKGETFFRKMEEVRPIRELYKV